MRSPFGKNAFYCCQCYGVAVEDLWVVSLAYIFRAVEARYDISQICTMRSILELVFIRSFLNLVTRAIVHVFLHVTLRLLFSFFVPVNFYSLIVCVPCV